MGIPVENMTSTPGAEAGTVNDMTVASSSALVPTNFVALNSAPVTLDGGKSVTQPITAPDFDWSQLAEETDLGAAVTDPARDWEAEQRAAAGRMDEDQRAWLEDRKSVV